MTSPPTKSFWTTLPGLMTGIASLLTATVTLLAFLHGGKKSEDVPPAGPANAADCREIEGDWAWFTGGVVHIAAAGELSWKKDPSDALPAVLGQWTCTKTTPRQYDLAWQHGISDHVMLSPDKKTLSGTNRTGVQVTGTRIPGS